MSVTQHLMRPGSGSLDLRSNTPVAVTNTIRRLVDENAGATATGAAIVITPERVPVDVLSDASILAAAIYNGPIIGRPSRTSLKLTGLGVWLDSHLDVDVSRSSGTPAQWVGDLLSNGLTAGTVTATGVSNISRTFPAHSATRREALDAWAGLSGGEYRINPNLTVDVGTAGVLFREAGDSNMVVVMRKAQGDDGTYRGVDGSLLDQDLDRLGPSIPTKAVALGPGDGAAITKGTATRSINLKTPTGATPTLVTVFSAPSEESGNVNSLASSFLGLQGMRRKVTVVSSTHHLPTIVKPGDEVYVFDPQSGLYDTDNTIFFNGQAINPVVVRLLSYTWPIERGMGVYLRPNAASPAYLDLTDWVAWETGDTFWTIGDWNPPSYGSVNRSNPEVEERVAGTGFKVGVTSGTTDGSGDLTITHGLGSTPTEMIATSRTIGVTQGFTNSPGPTTFKFRCYSPAGSVLTSTAVTIHWIVFA